MLKLLLQTIVEVVKAKAQREVDRVKMERFNDDYSEGFEAGCLWITGASIEFVNYICKDMIPENETVEEQQERHARILEKMKEKTL